MLWPNGQPRGRGGTEGEGSEAARRFESEYVSLGSRLLGMRTHIDENVGSRPNPTRRSACSGFHSTSERAAGRLGSLVPWFLGSLVPWFLGSLVPWFLGSLVPWCGVVEATCAKRAVPLTMANGALADEGRAAWRVAPLPGGLRRLRGLGASGSKSLGRSLVAHLVSPCSSSTWEASQGRRREL